MQATMKKLTKQFGQRAGTRLRVWLVAWGALGMCVAAAPGPAETPDGAARARQLERGERVYAQQCAGCHGLSGDGRGEAAALLYPKPRDFTSGDFKFSSRPTPGLPTDEDLRRTIREGLRGTAMNGFPLMREDDLTAVIAYLKTFSKRWGEWMEPPIVVPEDPWREDRARGIALGERVYHVDAVCISCHPSYLGEERVRAMSAELGFTPIPLRGDAHLSVPRETTEGSLVIPPDFRRDRIKTGGDPESLYRVITAGITTTAMPSWDGILDADKLWGLAHYVASLAAKRPGSVDPETYRLRPPMELEVEAGTYAPWEGTVEEGVELDPF
jgi:mono/diheme cytochrome c family protein